MSVRADRWMAVIPLLSTLLLQAVTHARWWLAIPCGAWAVWATARRTPPAYSRRTFTVAGAVGAALGLGSAFLFEPVPGIVPPPLLGLLCGGLAVVATYSVGTGQALYGWSYCALLAALSLTAPWTPVVAIAAVGVLVGYAALMAWHGGAARIGFAGPLAFAVFLGMTVGGAAALDRTLRESEGAVVDLIEQLLRDSVLPRGYGFEGQVGTPRRSKVAASDRVLFELEGDPAQRLRSIVLGELVDDRWHELRGAPQPAEVSAESATQTLTLLQELGNILPTPAGSTVSGVSATPRAGGVWAARPERGTVLTVRFDPEERLPVEPQPEANGRSVTEGLRAELAPFRAKIFRKDAQGAREKATAVEAFFRDGFEYTLDVDLAGEGHPLAVMIRERRAAYCTYFASAMAILLRLEGIPARVVGGFAPSERNPLTGVFTVRERDAHAWVEAYLPEEGRYVAFDPTPWRSRDALLPPKTPGMIAAAFDAASAWLRRGFNHLRANPGEVLVRAIQSPIVWAVVALVGIWRWRKRPARRRSRISREALQGNDAELVQLRRQYLRLLEKGAGVVAKPSETDDELLLRLTQSAGATASQAALRFLKHYQAARFGTGPERDRDLLVKALEDLSAELARKAA